jgi:hypothetical protein
MGCLRIVDRFRLGQFWDAGISRQRLWQTAAVADNGCDRQRLWQTAGVADKRRRRQPAEVTASDVAASRRGSQQTAEVAASRR